MKKKCSSGSVAAAAVLGGLTALTFLEACAEAVKGSSEKIKKKQTMYDINVRVSMFADSEADIVAISEEFAEMLAEVVDDEGGCVKVRIYDNDKQQAAISYR